MINAFVDTRQQIGEFCTFCNDIDDEFHFCLQNNLNVQPRNIPIKTMIDDKIVHRSILNHPYRNLTNKHSYIIFLLYACVPSICTYKAITRLGK